MKDVIYRDVIYRDDAIEAVRFNTFNTLNADERELEINRIPSAVTQDWIPISEGLPEEHEWVGTKKFGTTISDKVHITFDVNGERFVRTLSLQNGELSNYEKRTMDTLHKGWKMIAWMPLPKPYKGGEDE